MGNKLAQAEVFWRWSWLLFNRSYHLLFQVFIGGMAQIIQANITAENGIVHIIDQVRLRHVSAIFATFVC